MSVKPDFEKPAEIGILLMLFNSIEFAIFLPIVFILYWFVFNRNLRLQNLFVVAASLVFYGWWDWRFLSLILLSTVVDFSIGILLSGEENPKKRKIFVVASLMINLGLLGVFKYYNFFIDSFVNSFLFMGMRINAPSLNIILPVGISFYTFQTLSYSIDVYKRKLAPTRNLIDFTAFVSFFPQLVAGPIERASHLLPQFYRKREFDHDKAADGMRQILWGLFKKIVIADNCAELANLIFNNYANHSGALLFLGAILFSFQIYGDFSGYSDIAIGTSRLFGFDLMRNFNFPYFSRDIAEFWRRWHISLSTWFRDYLYIPLGGSRGGVSQRVKNTFILFLVSGFWHGANWTFLFWGFLNALFFIPLLLSGKNRKNLEIVAKGSFFPSIRETVQMAGTFLMVMFAWIFFRVPDITTGFSYVYKMLKGFFSAGSYLEFVKFLKSDVGLALPLLLSAFILLEWIGRDGQYAIEKLKVKTCRIMRWSVYYLIVFLIFWFTGKEQQFIYFQF